MQSVYYEQSMRTVSFLCSSCKIQISLAYLKQLNLHWMICSGYSIGDRNTHLHRLWIPNLQKHEWATKKLSKICIENMQRAENIVNTVVSIVLDFICEWVLFGIVNRNLIFMTAIQFTMLKNVYIWKQSEMFCRQRFYLTDLIRVLLTQDDRDHWPVESAIAFYRSI